MKTALTISFTLATVILVISGLFSCGQDGESTADTFIEQKETFNARENIDILNWQIQSYDKYIDTRNVYSDPNGQNLIIENSLPKGGLKYKDPDGQEYVYAIFWTQITNLRESPFELTLDFPTDSIELPSSIDNYFKIILPSEKMTLDKVTLFNYGLADMNAIIDNLPKVPSSKQENINSKETVTFYVVTLFKQGVDGAVRAGFSLKGDTIYYRVNDKIIPAGQHNIKGLELIK